MPTKTEPKLVNGTYLRTVDGRLMVWKGQDAEGMFCLEDCHEPVDAPWVRVSADELVKLDLVFVREPAEEATDGSS